jgi:hypothetical protein
MYSNCKEEEAATTPRSKEPKIKRSGCLLTKIMLPEALQRSKVCPFLGLEVGSTGQ